MRSDARAGAAPGTRSTAPDAAARTFGLQALTVETPVGATRVHASMQRSSDTALLLVHGAAASWATWVPLLDAAARRGAPLADVVAVDLPGWGDSPADVRHLDLDAVVDALLACVDAVGYARVRVVGHSLGGVIGLHLAAVVPERCVGVGIVSGPIAAAAAVARRPVRGAPRLPWYAGMLAVMRLGAAMPHATPRILRVLRATRLLRWIASPLFAGSSAATRAASDALADEVRPAAFLAAAQGAAASRPAAAWPRIRCTVTAVSGDRDVFVAPDDGAQLLALVPHAEWWVLPHCGHFPHVEHPDAVLALLLGDADAATR